jgi:tripartite-type tricarboxylate transporter receptor subunit TctC
MALREWYAFFMPAKTSSDTVQRAAAALEQAIRQSDVQEFGKQFGLEVQASTPRALADLLRADAAEWSGLARQTGFTADS